MACYKLLQKTNLLLLPTIIGDRVYPVFNHVMHSFCLFIFFCACSLATDILFAHYNGFQSLFVGTGVNSLKDVEKLRNSGNEKMMHMVPDTYLPKLCFINEFLL